MLKIRFDNELELFFPVAMCDWCDKEIENPPEGAALFKAAALTTEKPYTSVFFFHLYECSEKHKSTIPDFDWKEYRWLPIDNFADYFLSAAYYQKQRFLMEEDTGPEMV